MILKKNDDEETEKFNKLIERDLEKIKNKLEKYTVSEEFKEKLVQSLDYEYNKKN